MIRQNQRLLNICNVVSEYCLIVLSYFWAVYIRFNVMAGKTDVPLFSSKYIMANIIYGFALVFAYYCMHLYSSGRNKRIKDEVAIILGINLISGSVLMSVLYFLRVENFSRLMVFIWVGTATILVIFKRVIFRLVLRYYRKKGYNRKHIILVGNGKLAHQYIENVEKNEQYGYVVDGYVSRVVKEELGTCLGSYEDMEAILDNNNYDEIVVALEPHESIYMKDVLAAADKHGSRISIIPFYNDYIPAYPSIDMVGDVKLIDMRSTPLDNVGWSLLKRTIDIVGSLILIIVTSPIMLCTAIGVKISSPGPILFKQERVGKNKKNFTMFKFRSMRVTDTEKTGWSTDVDPRKTKFGSFIRKCSIDELPQFFNVLKGDMSLIGPRPEVPFHVNHFKDEIPFYLVRQQVRPGITGWAQVNGYRGDTSIVERVKCDIWYIENWSLWLDIVILFKTVFGGMINSEKIK